MDKKNIVIELFGSSDDAQKILDAVLRDGATGISGMRTAVRRKLSEVRELVEQAGYPSISAHLTFDHPEAELAYPYDADRYSLEEALEVVKAAYEAGLA